MIRILFSVLAAAAATGCRTAVPPAEKSFAAHGFHADGDSDRGI